MTAKERPVPRAEGRSLDSFECAGTAPAPSAAALSAGRDIVFEGLREFFELAASLSRSGEEAAFRGDETTIGVHIRQLRAVVVEIIQLRNELVDQNSNRGAT
jgi:hypothetical protein